MKQLSRLWDEYGRSILTPLHSLQFSDPTVHSLRRPAQAPPPPQPALRCHATPCTPFWVTHPIQENVPPHVGEPPAKRKKNKTHAGGEEQWVVIFFFPFLDLHTSERRCVCEQRTRRKIAAKFHAFPDLRSQCISSSTGEAARQNTASTCCGYSGEILRVLCKTTAPGLTCPLAGCAGLG